MGTTSSLRITRIKEEDAGTYQCRAENREDSMDASALIDIQVSKINRIDLLLGNYNYKVDVNIFVSRHLLMCCRQG